LAKGITLVEPGKGAMINYLQIVYSNLYGIFLLNEKLDTFDIIGSGMIFSSVIFTFLNNQLIEK